MTVKTSFTPRGQCWNVNTDLLPTKTRFRVLQLFAYRRQAARWSQWVWIHGPANKISHALCDAGRFVSANKEAVRRHETNCIAELRRSSDCCVAGGCYTHSHCSHYCTDDAPLSPRRCYTSDRYVGGLTENARREITRLRICTTAGHATCLIRVKSKTS